MESLRQFVPSQTCLKCDICCRYPKRTTSYVPCFFPKEIERVDSGKSQFIVVGGKIDLKTPPLPHKDCYICQFFIPEKNTCRIYSDRPLDCRLYPFMVTYDKNFESVILALDTKCPYAADKANSKELQIYADYLTEYLDSREMAEKINANKNFINDFQDDAVTLRRLENLSGRICFSGLGLKRLSLRDKALFDDYFFKLPFMTSSFAFNSVYVWSSLLNILWKKIDDSLCLFAGNDRDYFLFLPPIGKDAAAESFKILDEMNGDRNPASRIENVPEELSEELARSGLKVEETSQEYIYDQKEMAELKGNKFKSKRPLINKFLKQNKYVKRAFVEDDAFDCLELYGRWAAQKFNTGDDRYFRMLIEDSYFAQKTGLMNAQALNLQGVVAEIDGRIAGYSLGFPLNKDVFINLFETADLGIKGLYQFIFREFAAGLPSYKYINALSDSGLDSLKRLKESYHPSKKLKLLTARLSNFPR